MKRLNQIADWATIRMMRPPSEHLNDDRGLYLSRWYVFRARWFANIYLHKFHKSDDVRAMHNHPWFNASLLLMGSYIEHTLKGSYRRSPGHFYFRPPWRYHRVELLKDERGDEIPCYTLFLTGPKVQRWGFLCPHGFRPWRIFHAKKPDGKTVGCG